MSPERTRADAEVDGRSDLYGLGSTCYALLTGKPPFESDSLPSLVQMVRNETPTDPKEHQLSINDAFRDVVMKLLEKDPAERFSDPGALLKDLDRIGMFNSLKAD